MIELELNTFFVERQEPITGLINGWLSGANVLFLGPPGTAKSALITASTAHVQEAKVFLWLLHKFSTPEEVLGSFSLKGLEEDRFVRITTNKLPAADVAFLDEIFKCNSGMLNSLLPILNERVFHNDGRVIPIDLLLVAAASNEVPDPDDGLDALYDRFNLRYVVKPIQESSNFSQMLTNNAEYTPETFITREELLRARTEVAEVALPQTAIELLIKIRDRCKKDGISATDRSYKFMTRLLKTEAWRQNRATVTDADFEILMHTLWDDPNPMSVRKARSIVLELVSPELNQIRDQYDKSKTAFSEVLAADSGSTHQMELCVEAVTKVKAARVKMEELRRTMKRKGKDLSKANKLINEVAELNEKLVNNVMKFTAG